MPRQARDLQAPSCCGDTPHVASLHRAAQRFQQYAQRGLKWSLGLLSCWSHSLAAFSCPGLRHHPKWC
jgi:hypothetical protein